MIETFDEARELAERELAPLWGSTEGTFWVGTSGLEDAEGFVVEIGAREYLVDGDLSFMIASNTVTIVDRLTELVQIVARPSVLSRIEAMSPVSSELEVE